MSRTSLPTVGLRARSARKCLARSLQVERLEPRILMFAASGYKWANPDVSVSYLPDGTSTEGYTSTLFAELDAVAPRATWQREFARALQSWANVSNLNFRFVSDDGSVTGTFGSSQGDSRFGDIRLGAHPLTNGYIGYAYYPSSTTKGGDIFLEPNTTFKVGSYLDLYSTLVHEVGHAIGLAHGPSGSIMFPTIMSVYAGLAADDIAGVQSLYGVRNADSYDLAAANNTWATASGITISSPGTTTVRADLTSFADVDYYRVVAPTGTNGTLTVSLDARGKSLLAPKLSVFDDAGNLVQTVDSNGAYGSFVTVNITGLTAGKAYRLAVDGSGTDAFSMGAYKLDVTFGGTVTVTPPPPPPPPATVLADRLEANDGASTATNLGRISSTSLTGLTLHSTTDKDFLVFSVPKSGTYTVSVLTSAGAANIDLSILNGAQQSVAAGVANSSGETATASLTGGVNYYIRVSSATGALLGFDLSLARVGGSGARGKGANGGALDVGHGSFSVDSPGDHHDHDHEGEDEHRATAAVPGGPAANDPSGVDAPLSFASGPSPGRSDAPNWSFDRSDFLSRPLAAKTRLATEVLRAVAQHRAEQNADLPSDKSSVDRALESWSPSQENPLTGLNRRAGRFAWLS